MTTLTSHPTRNPTLPRTVRPITNEVLAQYLSRLAKANGIGPRQLESLLHQRGGTLRDGLVRSAGLTERAVVFALPELRTPQDLITYPALAGCTTAHTVGPGCPLCASRHGTPLAYPQVWSTHDTVVCHEHDMWLNGTAFRLDQRRPTIKLVGAAKADVLLSHRRHQWLITHGGRDATRQAIIDAYEIVEDWNRWKLLESVDYRCQELQPDPAKRGLGTSCFNAAAYPEVVMLAGVLSNPKWRRKLLHAPRPKLGIVLGDVIYAVLDGEVPYRAPEPLYEWRAAQRGMRGIRQPSVTAETEPCTERAKASGARCDARDSGQST